MSTIEKGARLRVTAGNLGVIDLENPYRFHPDVVRNPRR